MTSSEDKFIKKTMNIYEYQREYYTKNIEKLRESARERSKKMYEDEEYRAQKLIKMRERAKIRLQDPEYKAKLLQKRRDLYINNIEYRNKIKERSLNRVRDNPEIKDKINHQRRSEYAFGKENANNIKSQIIDENI